MTTPENSDTPEKALTMEDFVLRWPMYTPFRTPLNELPTAINLSCDTPNICEKETTWSACNVDASITTGKLQHRSVTYLCTRCRRNQLIVLYKFSVTPNQTSIGLDGMPLPANVCEFRKIGQWPPMSIDVPHALAENLGKAHTELYKRALITRNDGYGLASVAYLRRVVEDKTDELIGVVADYAQAIEVDAAIVAEIRDVVDSKAPFDKKLELASLVLPLSLRPGGHNPLGTLFTLVSKGLHQLSEEECIRIADDTRFVFEFTFQKLKAETQGHTSFADKLAKLAGGSAVSRPTSSPPSPPATSAPPSPPPDSA